MMPKVVSEQAKVLSLAYHGVQVGVGSLAHNVIIWVRGWLAVPNLHHYRMLRMVRDVLHSSDILTFDATGQMIQLVLNQAAP